MCISSQEDVIYFTEVLHFMHKFQWVYNFPVTKILVDGFLDMLPKDWLEILENLEIDELNELVVNKRFKFNWPDSLTSFLNKCKTLDKLPTKTISKVPTLPIPFLKGFSLKKQHEILEMTELIHCHCMKQNIDTIVDLGAGLGYVCQLLHYLHNYQVLGVEGSAQNVKTVKYRQNKFYPESLNFVKYVHCNVTGDSAVVIESVLHELFPNHGNICLIGLHACGDLSVNMFKIYSDLRIAKLLILLSCCYHKLTTVDGNLGNKEYFTNFPISETFTNAVKMSQLDIGFFLRRPFLRLACQETADRWQGMSEDSHNEHSFHVLARAVLELYAVQNDYNIQKQVRKATRKSQCLDFQSYINDSFKRYIFQKMCDEEDNWIENKPDEEDIKQGLTILWEKNSSKMKTVEVFSALQMLLQSVAESIVLSDRLCWLKENGYTAQILPVTNRKLSPRCHAIVSSKS